MKYLLTKFAQQIIDPGDIKVPQGTLRQSNVQDGLQIFFGIASAVAMLVITLSALRIVLARGNADEVHKSRDAIIYATVGLAISMSGYVIVTYFLENI